MEEEKVHSSETIRLELADQVTFLNKATIKDTLWNVPDKSKVIIDATYSDFIEDDILELLKSYRDTYAPSHGIQVNIIGLREKYNFSDHIQFINVLSQQELDKLSPTEIVALLKDGNKRFVEGRWSEKYIKHQVNATAMGQYPMAAVISCFDSRTAPEMVFDCGVGDLLSLRVAGNVINKDIIGSLELACQKLGLKQIVVMGHTKCGAVKASVDQRFDNNFAHIQEKIDKAIQACGCPVDKIDTEDDEIMTKISVLNAKNSMTTLLQNSPYLKEEVDKGNIGIVATMYDITTGEVDFLS
jgi:carbonic anhydrase